MTRITLSLFAAALFVVPSIGGAQDVPRGPQGGAGTVTMSRAEYDRLLDLATRRPGGVDNAPPAALTRADIRVRVAGV